MAWLWILSIPAAFVILLAFVWVIGERGRVLGLPSTRAALKGDVGVPPRKLNLDVVHAYFYGRWTNQYIGFARRVLMPLMSPEAKQRWADHYHGKVVPLELAEAIITLDHDISRRDLEQIIPYPTARNIVLSGPPDVTIYECGCRLSKQDHCEPTQVCMIIGDGSFVLDHNPRSSRRIGQQEALDLLRAEHERGHVHAAYFKDVCNNQFYAICNCCACCCGGIEAMANGVPMVSSSGYVARVNDEACLGCGDCAAACPFDAITLDYSAVVDWELCMGCGVCEGRCTHGAITLALDERKGIPLDVRKIAV